MEAACDLAGKVRTLPACRALTVSRATFYRRLGGSIAPEEATKPRPTPARALSPAERQVVLDTLNSECFLRCLALPGVGHTAG